MSEDNWGYGNPEDKAPFDTFKMNGREWELLWGEHPHSRSDNRMYARSPSGDIEEFNGHRLCWRIEVEEHNYMKESELSGDEIRKGGSYRLFVDGECIYEGFCREIDYGMRAALEMKAKLEEAAGMRWLRAKDRAKLVGKKIWYDRTPAIIERLIVDQGCLWIVPEEGHRFPAPVYTLKDPAEAEDYLSEYGDGCKIEVTSPLIWWWRD